jgi:hypothetical protein
MNNHIVTTIMELQQALLKLLTHDVIGEDVKQILTKKAQMDIEAIIDVLNDYIKMGDDER